MPPAAWGEEGESPCNPPPVTLSQLPPCNSHSDVLAHWGQGGTSGRPGRERGTALDPHTWGDQVAKPRTSSISERGDAWPGSSRAAAPKASWEGGNEGPRWGRFESKQGGGEGRLFRQTSSWQAAAWYVYPGRCYKSSLRLNAATAEVAVIRSAHSEILIKSQPRPQRRGARSVEAPLGHAHVRSVPAGDAGPV